MSKLSLSKRLALSDRSDPAGEQALPPVLEAPQQPPEANAVDEHDAEDSPTSQWTCGSEDEPQPSQEDVAGCEGKQEEFLYGSEADYESEWEEDSAEDDVIEKGRDTLGADLDTNPQPHPQTEGEEAPAAMDVVPEEKEGNHHTGSYKLKAGEYKQCQVCGLDLSVLNFLHQVQHVKQCMAKRLGGRSAAAPLARPPTAVVVPKVSVVDQPQAASSSGVLHLDIREWLKGLQLEQYQEVFVAEEIDMTIVHALTDSDLRSLGVVDRLHQRRILDAARIIGAQIAAAKRARRSALVPVKLKQQVLKPLALPPEEKQRQQAQAASSVPNLLQGQGAASSSRAVYQEPPTAAALLAPSKARNTEQGIFKTLYPDDPNAAPLPTPPLEPAAALASSRAAPNSSLWASAARCEQVTDALEVRIEKRKATRPPGEPEEELCRGGITYTRADESRALKALKLEALKEELKTHEATVQELRRLVADLEAELRE